MSLEYWIEKHDKDLEESGIPTPDNITEFILNNTKSKEDN
jgi:hypothetical protein